MKRLIVLAVMSGCAVWSVTAQDVDGRKGLSEPERTERNAVVTKHDLDGDGVLSKSELKGLTKEEKKLLARTGGVGTAKKASVQTEARAKGNQARVRTEAAGDLGKGKSSGTSAGSKGASHGKGSGGKR